MKQKEVYISLDRWKKIVLGIRILFEKKKVEELWKEMKKVSWVKTRLMCGDNEEEKFKICRFLMDNYITNAEYDGKKVRVLSVSRLAEEKVLLKLGKVFGCFLSKNRLWKLAQGFGAVKKDEEWNDLLPVILQTAGLKEREENEGCVIKEINRENEYLKIEGRNKEKGIILRSDKGMLIVYLERKFFRYVDVDTGYYFKSKEEIGLDELIDKKWRREKYEKR